MQKPALSSNRVRPRLGQGLRVLSHQALADALNNIALTSQYTGDLENLPMEVWGVARKAARGSGRPGPSKPEGAPGGIGGGQQTLKECLGGLRNPSTRPGRSWRSYAGLMNAGQ